MLMDFIIGATTQPEGTTPFDWGAMWSTVGAGALGGICLIVGRFVLTYIRIQDSPLPKIKPFLLIQIPLLISMAFLGGAIAWVTTGVSGAFLAGVGALGFILLAGGQHIDPEHQRRRERSHVQTDSPKG